MKEIIKIGDKEVTIENNAAWLLEYKDQFGKDILPTLMPLFTSAIEAMSSVISETGTNDVTIEAIAEALEGRTMEFLLPLYNAELADLAINVTWAMAKAADEDIDPPKKWIRQFDTYPLDVVLPAVMRLALKGSISSKNLRRLKKMQKDLKALQPSRLTTSSSPDKSED